MDLRGNSPPRAEGCGGGTGRRLKGQPEARSGMRGAGEAAKVCCGVMQAARGVGVSPAYPESAPS